MNIYSRDNVQGQFGQLSGGLTKDFGVVETILRDRHQFFEEIRQGIGVPEKTRSMLVSSVAFLAVYGAVLGSTHSLLQALSSAAKLPILFLITFATTKERVVSPAAERSTIKRDALDLLQNRPWVILFGVGVLFVSLTTFRGGVTLYYFKYYIENVEIAAIFMVVGLLAAMGGAALTGPLTARFGKRVVMNGCLILGIVSSAAIYGIRPEGIAWIFILQGY